MLACAGGHLRCVELLAKRGVDLNAGSYGLVCRCV